MSFVTVKGEKYPREGFFQAFLAAERGSAIVRRSLKMMLEALYEERPRGKYLDLWLPCDLIQTLYQLILEACA